MKLTLRKANVIQTAINEMIKNLNSATVVQLNEFEDVSEQIQVARNRFFIQAATRNKLIMSLYEIRQKVAQANAEVGINDQLAQIAYLEKQISYNNMLVNAGCQTPNRVLNGQLKKLAEIKEDNYYSRRDVSTSIFSEEEIEDFKRAAADFKRQKQRLQDDLLELNVQTEIEIDEDTATFLEKADIL